VTAEPSSSFRFGDCDFAFRLEGRGPPIVLIQGVGVHGRGWTPQTDELRADFHCLTVDNRGMGESQPPGGRITVQRMAEDALELMRHVGWDSAHVVGHSLGGPVALEMALTHPTRVRSLALLCTVARGRDATRLGWRMLGLGLRSRIGSRPARRHAFLRIVMPPGSLPRDTTQLAEELRPIFGHDLADQPPIALKQLSALRAWDGSGRLAELAAIPTLVVSGAHDPIAPPRFGRALAAAIPGARHVEYEDASHGLPIQHAARVNDVLRTHIGRAEADRHLARDGSDRA
jgi:aminoacrylate hydrolase